MGKEIGCGDYTDQDLQEFLNKLKNETNLLKKWFDEKSFAQNQNMTGIELEAWLVDENMLPDPYAPEFLENLNNKKVVPEIAKFNF